LNDYNYDYAVGLKLNGSVVSVGSNSYDQLNTGSWQDIIAICMGSEHTVGLKSNGTVVATGDNKFGQINTDTWHDIVAICAIVIQPNIW
jgi:alpha-tubulin suppressor-like RCC1 family protein